MWGAGYWEGRARGLIEASGGACDGASLSYRCCMALVRDAAICVRAWEWSQTSQMVVAFSRERGLLRGVAKGARRLGSNYAGGFEPLTLGDIVFSTAAWEKAASSRDNAGVGGLVTITAWEVLELFPAGRKSLRHFLACCCMLDLVQRGMQEADPHPAVFDALARVLRGLAEGAMSAPEGLATFAWTLLLETGHAPDVSSNIRGGGVLTPAKVYVFWPRLGGFSLDVGETPIPVQANQSREQVQPNEVNQNDGSSGPAWRVRGETLLALRQLAMPGLGTSTAKGSGDTNAQVWTRAANLLVQYFREVHQTDVPAVGEWLKDAK